MNKQRRKQLDELREKIDRMLEDLSTLRDEAESIRDEEQEYYDNMPENMRDGDKGCEVSNGLDELNSMVEALDEADTKLADAVGNIETAQGG